VLCLYFWLYFTISKLNSQYPGVQSFQVIPQSFVAPQHSRFPQVSIQTQKQQNWGENDSQRCFLTLKKNGDDVQSLQPAGHGHNSFDLTKIPSKPLVGTSQKIITSLVAGEAFLAYLTFFLGFIFDSNPLSQITQFGWNTIVQGLLYAVPLVIFGTWLDNSKLPQFAEVKRSTDMFVLSLFGTQLRASKVLSRGSLLALAAGFCEELLFRGFILPMLANVTENNIIALLLSSLLFGLGHSTKPNITLLIETGLGLSFGMMFLATGNLAVPMVAHFFYDCLTFLLVHIRVTSQVSRIESSTKAVQSIMRGYPEILDRITMLQEQYALSKTFLDRCTTVFVCLDLDCNGMIDAGELRLGYKTFGERLSRRQVNDIMAQADIDQNGYLDLGEFVALMVKVYLRKEKNGLVSYITRQRKNIENPDDLLQSW